mmetsp:Transcript_36934/g.81053  ORF Transcript_36934/g.81053 Transcript_36934/m.81053 type:complete len:250 (-) Transcript_36934:185-934(-)
MMRVVLWLGIFPNHLLRWLVNALQHCPATLIVVFVLEVVTVHPAQPLHRVLQEMRLPVANEVLNLGNIHDGKGIDMPVRLLLDGHRGRDLDHPALPHSRRDIALRTRQGASVIPPVAKERIEGLEFGVDLLAIPNSCLTSRVTAGDCPGGRTARRSPRAAAGSRCSTAAGGRVSLTDRLLRLHRHGHLAEHLWRNTSLGIDKVQLDAVDDAKLRQRRFRCPGDWALAFIVKRKALCCRFHASLSFHLRL